MNNKSLLKSVCRFAPLACLAALVLGAAVSAAEVRADRKRFDVAAQGAASALVEFGRQAKLQLLFSSELVERIRTNSVTGLYEPYEALKLLLQGTSLRFESVAPNVVSILSDSTQGPAVQPRAGQTVPVSGTAGMHLAEAANGATPPSASSAQAQEGAGKSTAASKDDAARELVITGSRIRSLVGEQSIQPVLTVTAREIERYGVASLGEVFSRIPQLSGVAVGQMIQVDNTVANMFSLPSVTASRVTATLRGAPAGGTLLLINGRRAPKNGQQAGADAYDLSGIPLSAIERIEVLLDGASVMYGADAVGGVINVILKRNYSGTSARLGYENTFEADAATKSASISHGFSLKKLSGTLTLSRQEASSMLWRDRWFLQSFDRRFLGGTDQRLTSQFAGRGIISSVSGNLPGLSSNQAVIPAASSGVNLSAQDFANAGPLPPLYDDGQYAQYSTPYRRTGFIGNLEYEFRPWLKFAAEYRWGDSRNWAINSPISLSNFQIPANTAGNPFGVPIRLTKRFFDLPIAAERISGIENRAASFGLHGELWRDWRYEAAASLTKSLPNFDGNFGGLSTALLTTALSSASPPILLYDSTSGISPNAPGVLEAFFTDPQRGVEHVEGRVYDFQLDGSILTLPAGEVRLAAGAEYREDYANFPLPAPPGAASIAASLNRYDRYGSGYFAELRVPLISARQALPLLDRLELNLALRHDGYNDFPGQTSARYGVLYRPFHWLALRGSYGEGYKVPTLSQLFRPVSTTGTASENAVDAFRGNQAVTGPRPVIGGGNPGLRPEHSENMTAGLVFEMPFVPGLSLSFGYYNTDYLDLVGSIALTDRIVLFPETVTRGPNLSNDPSGWLGPIVSYDSRPGNIALSRIRGYDLEVRYTRVTDRGEFTLNAAANRTLRREIRSAPHLPPTAASTADSLPLQATGSFFWTRGAFETGVLFAHRAQFRSSTTTTTYTPQATRWDWQGSYDFGRSSALAGRRGPWGSAALLADTKISVTVFNVLNTTPPLQTFTRLPDNTVVDSRLRRYAVQIAKQF